MSTLKITLNVCSNFLLIEITLRYRRRLSRRSLGYINSDKDTRTRVLNIPFNFASVRQQ